MQIVQVLPDDAALVDGVLDVHAAAEALDCPWQNALTARSLRSMARCGWDGEPPWFYAGLRAGQVVASGEVWLPMRDNLQNALWTATVHPQHRRHGLGTQMSDHLEAVAEAQGRTVLSIHANESDGASAFATRRGYELKYIGVTRRVTIADVPAETVDAAYRESLGKATDYDVVRIAGPLTDEQIADSLPVVASINDAPTDDLVIEDDVFTPERLRADDDAKLDGAPACTGCGPAIVTPARSPGTPSSPSRRTGLARGAARHHRATETPGTPARAAAQGRHDALASRRRAGPCDESPRTTPSPTRT